MTDPRLSAIEALPGYWLARARVRADYARELSRQSASDAASDAVTKEYQMAQEYERRAAILTASAEGAATTQPRPDGEE